MGATPIITQKCSIEVDIKTNMMLYGVSVVNMRDKPINVYAVNVQKVSNTPIRFHRSGDLQVGYSTGVRNST